MSKKNRHQDFRLTPTVIIRLILFIVLVYSAISYFSSNSSETLSDPTILGTEIASYSAIPQLKNIYDDIYNYLPPSSREVVENLSDQPAIIYLQKKMDYLKEESSGFPQKQITNIKRAIIESVYKDIMKNYGN